MAFIKNKLILSIIGVFVAPLLIIGLIRMIAYLCDCPFENELRYGTMALAFMGSYASLMITNKS